MDAKVLIPVRKHIQKYLTIHFGQIMNVSDTSPVAALLLNMLRQCDKLDPALIRPSTKMIDQVKYFGFPVYIGAYYYNNNGAYISKDNVNRFNKIMNRLICEEMYRTIHLHPDPTDHVVDYNIRRFQDWYGFSEDEMSFDNLKRWYYRERIRIKDRLTFKPDVEPQLTIEWGYPKEEYNVIRLKPGVIQLKLSV